MEGSAERRFHVSPSVNRDSIARFGLDWKRMNPSEPGIANGQPGRPELEGIFLTPADTDAARFFVKFGHGRRVDVWQVDVTGLRLEPGPDGWEICPAVIPSERVELVEVWDTGGERAFGEPTSVPLPRMRGRRKQRG